MAFVYRHATRLKPQGRPAPGQFNFTNRVLWNSALTLFLATAWIFSNSPLPNQLTPPPPQLFCKAWWKSYNQNRLLVQHNWKPHVTLCGQLSVHLSEFLSTGIHRNRCFIKRMTYSQEKTVNISFFVIKTTTWHVFCHIYRTQCNAWSLMTARPFSF